jgi:anti-sigma factor RsiW
MGKLMNCEEINQVSALWHSGELEGTARKDFDAHLASCAACAAVVREQWNNDARLREALAEEPADTRDVEQRVMRQIGRERMSRFLWRRVAPALATAAVLIAGVAFLMSHRGTPVNPTILADAARDHTLEVIQESPRRWRTNPADIAVIEKTQGISDADVKALETTGYQLERAKICRLGSTPYMHLVYAKNGRRFSVYLRVRGDRNVRETASNSGDLQLASFSRGHVQAVIVTDAPKGECAQFTREAEGAL